MYEILKKLLFSRQISFDEGKIKLLDQPVVITPVIIYSKMLQIMRKKYGKEGDKIFYNASKETGIKYMTILKEKYRMSKNEMSKWAANSITLSGWGKVKVMKYDFSKCVSHIIVEDSVFANSYGKSKISTDVILQGFFAGGATSIFGKNVECKEIKCVSKGDPFCEFIIE